MESEEYKDEKIGKIPSIFPDSKNDFSNIHEDVSSFPKVFLEISFSDMMNRPICDIKEEKNTTRKTKNNNFIYKDRNSGMFGKYLCEGISDSITVVCSESHPPNLSNGTADDRGSQSMEVEADRGCMYVTYIHPLSGSTSILSDPLSSAVPLLKFGR